MRYNGDAEVLTVPSVVTYEENGVTYNIRVSEVGENTFIRASDGYLKEVTVPGEIKTTYDTRRRC